MVGAIGPSLRSSRLKAFPMVAWSPDAEHFASTGYDGRLRLWNSDGTTARPFRTDLAGIRSFAWSPDGSRIAVSRDGIQLLGLDGNLETQLKVPNGQTATSIAWNPDGTQLAASINCAIMLVDVNQQQQPVLIKAHSGKITKVRWSPDGRWFASASKDQTIRLWTPEGDEGPVMEGFSGDVDSMAWTADSRQILAGYDTGDWEIWSVDGEPTTIQTGHVDAVMGLTSSPDGTQIASAGWDQTIRLWSAEGQQTAQFDALSGPVFYLDWSPDGERIAAGGWDRTLRVWSMESHRTDTVIVFLDDGQTATFNADGTLLEGDPQAVEETFMYLVEQPNGATEILSRTQFLNRTGRRNSNDRTAAR
jgi:WD40 repeat protein